jgi:hypothetical protein
MSNQLEEIGSDENANKKTYHKPELVTYGDIREITKVTGGLTGMNDGGGGPDKTSP